MGQRGYLEVLEALLRMNVMANNPIIDVVDVYLERTPKASEELLNPIIHPTRLQLETSIKTLLSNNNIHNKKKILWIEQFKARLAYVH